MTLNASKCHLLVSGYKDEFMFAKVGDELLCEEHSAKLLGIIIYSSLKFDNHLKTICKKASQKLTAISRMSDYLLQITRTVLIRSFFESQFDYCPLILIFCGRRLNHRINKHHERALRIAYNNYSSGFKELLTKDDTVTIHQRNLRAFAIEMYKISNDLSFYETQDDRNMHSVQYKINY